MTMKSERPLISMKLVCGKCSTHVLVYWGRLAGFKKISPYEGFEGQVSCRVQRGARETYQEEKIKIIGYDGRPSGFRWYNENYQPVRRVMVKISYGASSDSENPAIREGYGATTCPQRRVDWTPFRSAKLDMTPFKKIVAVSLGRN